MTDRDFSDGAETDARFTVLASASPRRKRLLAKIPRLNVAVFPSGGDETVPPSLGAREAAVLLAERKADTVYRALTEEKLRALFGRRVLRGEVTVLGADTVVVAPNGEILGKPKRAEEAYRMLKLLSGNTHSVITGYCLRKNAKKVKNFVETHVTFGAIDDRIVYNYINSGSPFDKSGGYGIQDETIGRIVLHVEGDVDNVIGLPVGEIEKTIKEFF